MRRFSALVWLLTLAVAAGAVDGPLIIQPCWGPPEPVLSPVDGLSIRLQFHNTGAEELPAAIVWGTAPLILETPDHSEIRLSGAQLLELSEHPAVVEAGHWGAAVIELGELFDLEPRGRYRLEWRNDYGADRLAFEVLTERDYLLQRLRADTTHNHWMLYLYGEDGLVYADSLAGRLAGYGRSVVAELDLLLDDETTVFIQGSEEATLGSMYAHRVCDYAAFILADILELRLEELRSMDPQERDEGIERLRRELEDR
jgi:hypothetical protein